jgi:mRNA interferase MazF
MKRGEVRWYKFDPPDKRRPVVILTRDSVLDYLDKVTVAFVTFVIRDVPTQVVLSEQDGMPRECAVNCDHVQTIAKGKIGSAITTLPADRMEEIRQAIAFALDL